MRWTGIGGSIAGDGAASRFRCEAGRKGLLYRAVVSRVLLEIAE